MIFLTYHICIHMLYVLCIITYCVFSFKDDQIQLVVLLERLLEREAMATATLTQLDNCYRFSEKNAEVGLSGNKVGQNLRAVLLRQWLISVCILFAREWSICDVLLV